MTLVVVNYGIGNLNSIVNMLKRVGVNACISGEKSVVETAERLILPGVGHFDACMEKFSESGLLEVVQRKWQDGLPVLGICVGAQMMTRNSQEGSRAGLGWVEADTVRFQQEKLRVPHMGWADLQVTRPCPLWLDLPPEPRFYFAHSYHFQFDDDAAVVGRASHGYDFPCAFQRGNLFGVQFHPEKSHRYGLAFMKNFATASCL